MFAGHFWENITQTVKLLNIPPVRPIRVDMVDSGPGQIPSQKDVQFCDKHLFHLLDSNYYARVSLADYDSFMKYSNIQILLSVMQCF